MTQIRRTPYAFFYLEDDYLPEVASLLTGEMPLAAPCGRIVALVILTGERHRIDRRELELLWSVPAERWVDVGGRDGSVVDTLTDKALLLSDTDDSALLALRRRDEALSSSAWNLYAALYHFMTQWSDVDTGDGIEDYAEIAARDRDANEELAAKYGPPDGAFAESPAGPAIALPGEDRDGRLFRTLKARRTTRAFDTRQPMELRELDTVLRYVFGCHGYRHSAGNVLCIKRTSPSGGGLHPIEAYPIVTNVSGVASGIYHYNVRDHALVQLRELGPADAQQTATGFMCGQTYFGAAHVSFVLTARFYRNHWKYRSHHKAYAGILMDAAHLAQTLYLVSEELGLGAFVTLAINARDVERALGFDGVTEGVISMVGCGLRAGGESPLEPAFSATRPV